MVPPALTLNRLKKSRHVQVPLLLHFDVNKTVIQSDSVQMKGTGKMAIQQFGNPQRTLKWKIHRYMGGKAGAPRFFLVFSGIMSGGARRGMVGLFFRGEHGPAWVVKT